LASCIAAMICGFVMGVKKFSARRIRGEEPFIETKAWLELRGTATERVSGVSDVQVSMYPEDKPAVGTARPAACGAIIRARPQLELVLSWPHAISIGWRFWRLPES